MKIHDMPTMLSTVLLAGDDKGKEDISSGRSLRSTREQCGVNN
jgi:hypothetical protein